jgi:putative transposase
MLWIDEAGASSLRGENLFSRVKLMTFKRNLPRLAPEWYRGRAWVFWTHTIDHRASGWLDERFHWEFREALCHAQSRQNLACPIYVLMPDHIHLIWIGGRDSSDQLLATRFLRKELNRLLQPLTLQKQPHDHVLREEERKKSAFDGIWSYIANNPERADLVKGWREYSYLGSLIPGYAGLDPRDKDFFEGFWKAFALFSEA